MINDQSIKTYPCHNIVMQTVYKISQSKSQYMHPVQSLWNWHLALFKFSP